MRYSNLQTHSVFSDGKHSLEENVRSAIEKGMCSLGFSDHSFTPCDTSYCMDLTGRARAGKLDRVIGRDTETERVIQILSRQIF